MGETVKKPEIFILDDSFEHIKFISGFLRDNNYCIRVATNAEYFFENIKKAPPDLILLDIMLPDLDGFTICKMLKDDNDLKEIPIIFLTSVEDKKSTLEGFEVGGQDYIQKPVDLHVLLARVNTHIKLKQKTQKLREAYKDIENFNHMVCHDLKSPLGAIKTLSELLYEECSENLSEEKMDLLISLKEKSIEAILLIEKLSEISKISSDVLNVEKVDLKNIIVDSFDLLSKKCAHRKIELKMDEFDCIYADKILIKQVIYNILSNSIKFTKKKENAFIKVTYETDINFSIISIEDNGEGFNMKYSEKLFNIFQRLHSDEYEGIGAGLAIVKKIIQKHGGKVWIKSKEDIGTKVSFSLPLKGVS